MRRKVGHVLCIWDPHFGEGEVTEGLAMVPFERAMEVSYRRGGCYEMQYIRRSLVTASKLLTVM